MSSATLKVGVVAIIVGLVGAYLFRSYLAQDVEAAQKPPETVLVPMSNVNLPAGKKIHKGDIGMMPMTSAQLQSQGWDLTTVMLTTDDIIGRTLKDEMGIGQPFLTTGLYPVNEGPNRFADLRPGFRASAINVPEHRGGFVKPGTTVDVMFRTDAQELDNGKTIIPEGSITLMQGIRVIDVMRPELTELQAVVGYVAKEPTVTLEVDLRQAKILETVRDQGQFSLMIRPEGEIGAPVPDTDMLTLKELLGIEATPEPEPPEPAPAPQKYTLVYRGGRGTVNAFPGNPAMFAPTAPARDDADTNPDIVLPEVDAD